MLQSLLDEIKKGGPLSVDILAERLQTTPAMVKAMLEHLVRQNLIRPFQSCVSSCTNCDISELCVSRKPDSDLMLYTLTMVVDKQNG